MFGRCIFNETSHSSDGYPSNGYITIFGRCIFNETSHYLRWLHRDVTLPPMAITPMVTSQCLYVASSTRRHTPSGSYITMTLTVVCSSSFTMSLRYIFKETSHSLRWLHHNDTNISLQQFVCHLIKLLLTYLLTYLLTPSSLNSHIKVLIK